MSNQLVSACVWRADDDLVESLLDRFGEPVDGYVNGSQVWLRDEPLANNKSITIEYRLHPVAAFTQPAGQDHHTLFVDTLDQLSPRDLKALWDGLEAFAAYGDEIEPSELSRCATDALGITPGAAGLVDHEKIGDAWQSANGKVSIVELLLQQLSTDV